MSIRANIVFAAAAAALLAAPASSLAAERWAAPDGDGASPCFEADPCSLQDALTGAVGLDEVIVTTGTSDYGVTGTLTVPTGVTLRAADADDRPRIVAGSGHSGGVVAASGTGTLVAGLEIVGPSSSAVALDLGSDATGAQLVLRAGSVGVRIAGSGVTLRDSLALSTGTTSSSAAVSLRDGTSASPVRIVNVTAIAQNGSARGIRCGAGYATVANSIVRGGLNDIHDTGTECTVSDTAFRAATSTASIEDGGGNISADPVYEATGDHVPALSSPTVDAGRADGSEATRRDVAGAARVQNGKLDMGAHEAAAPPPPAPAPTTGTPADDGAGQPAASAAPAAPPAAPATTATTGTSPQQEVTLPPATAPDLGRTINLEAAAGTVRVKLPGTDRYVDLSDASTLPVGTVVDTNDGSVTLTSQLADGTTQTGTFGGGKFSVAQPVDEQGMTDIVLRGGWFQSCIPASERAARAALKARGKVTARAAAAAGRKRKAVRKLWSKDRGGKFRTHGSTSITTVRGTSWVTEDRCEGTVTKVTEGAVDVRAKRGGKVTRVKAGQSVLVKRLPRAKLR